MNRITLLFAGLVLITACSTRKTETTDTTDSLKTESDSSDLALVPAPSILASSPVDGYIGKNTNAITDSINFILLSNSDELAKNFEVDKTSGVTNGDTDFFINYIVGVVCKASPFSTTIAIDKVQVAGDEISVYVSLVRGEKLKTSSMASRIFAIERRSEISTMQFYVNGEKGKSFFMTGL